MYLLFLYINLSSLANGISRHISGMYNMCVDCQGIWFCSIKILTIISANDISR